jgi:hypothetical protein
MNKQQLRLLGALAAAVALAAGVSACGSSNNGNRDMGGGGDGGGNCTPANTRKFYIDTVTVPQTKMQYAYDLNGDNKVDNALGGIIGALKAQMVDAQVSVDAALSTGNVVMLVTESSSDATYMNDSCATSVVSTGKNQMPNTGAYMIDTTLAQGNFTGTLTSAAFDSTTSRMPPDVQMILPLPILPGQVIKVPIHGAHVQYSAMTAGVTAGRLNGGVTKQDIDAVVVPGVAAGFDTQVQMDPGSQNSMTILTLFDVGNGNGGNCVNPDGTMGMPNDMRIATCEVAGSQIIQTLLAPDVQLFQGGAYNPNPANTAKDSLSLGLAFTGVPSSF